MGESKLYAKQILKDPKKYFTDDIMSQLDHAASHEFSYGAIDDTTEDS